MLKPVLSSQYATGLYFFYCLVRLSLQVDAEIIWCEDDEPLVEISIGTIIMQNMAVLERLSVKTVAFLLFIYP